MMARAMLSKMDKGVTTLMTFSFIQAWISQRPTC